MNSTVMAIIAVVILIVAIALIWILVRRGRSQRLKSKFGPEYDRTVQQAGNRGKAEKDLESRQKRREGLEIKPLDPGLRERRAHRARRRGEARIVAGRRPAVHADSHRG